MDLDLTHSRKSRFLPQIIAKWSLHKEQGTYLQLKWPPRQELFAFPLWLVLVTENCSQVIVEHHTVKYLPLLNNYSKERIQPGLWKLGCKFCRSLPWSVHCLYVPAPSDTIKCVKLCLARMVLQTIPKNPGSRRSTLAPSIIFPYFSYLRTNRQDVQSPATCHDCCWEAGWPSSCSSPGRGTEAAISVKAVVLRSFSDAIPNPFPGQGLIWEALGNPSLADTFLCRHIHLCIYGSCSFNAAAWEWANLKSRYLSWQGC